MIPLHPLTAPMFALGAVGVQESAGSGDALPTPYYSLDPDQFMVAAVALSLVVLLLGIIAVSGWRR